MSRVSSWQGSLRSSSANGNNAGVGGGLQQQQQQQQQDKMQRGANGGSTRSALGDISNRGMGGGLGGGKGLGGKKAGSKPFAIVAEAEAEAEAADEGNLPLTLEQEIQQAAQIQEALHYHHRMPPPKVDRVDEADLGNPKYAAEYVGCIYKHFRSVESKYLPGHQYMTKQTDINEKMRALLVDWLIQVHVKFELLPQTLYLTVNLLDRFLERKIVPRRKLQLVGCAAMLAASKVEEIFAPELCDFVSMSDKAFTSDELLKMEGILLNVLNFNLTTPSPYTFLRRYMKVACSTAKTQHFATYLVERSLQEYSMLRFKPSMIAGSALLIAQSLTDDRKTWGATLNRHSGYTPDLLTPCTETMRELYAEANQKNYLQAVTKKYSSSKFLEVGRIAIA